MKPFVDASFLVSFCARDANTVKAHVWWRGNLVVMQTTKLALFEAENAIRVLTLDGKITPAEEHKALESLKRMALEGFLVIREVPPKRLYPAARRLSQFHTKTCGYGAVDILHVAGALEMRLDCMISFDRRQRQLAVAEGMAVQPL